jgi:Adenosyl cobinamide kinase/adenosyl cobinamide phosphate guanylyltransferase
MMGKKILVLGGIRSGKSEYAESCLAEEERVVYVAAAQVPDAEMQERIARHRMRRSETWETREDPFDWAATVRASVGKTPLLESVGTWISNRLMRYPEYSDAPTREQRNDIERAMLDEVQRLCDAIREHDGSICVVSEEVGMSMVSLHPLGRLFEDVLGTANQMLAQVCEEVVLVVAGCPLVVKSARERMEQRKARHEKMG